MAADDEPLTAYKARSHDSRPLIERVNNQWKDEKHDYPHDTDDDIQELGFCDLENPGSCPNVATSRRFRRMIAYLLLAATVALYLWSQYLRPRLQEEWAYEEGFVSQENGTYGIARGGDVDPDLVRIKSLDTALLPGGSADTHGQRRLVFVGDVHGCKKELLKLLDKVAFNEKTDHLILTGDIISKGPDNVGVLDELIRLKATSVRGNHEDRILQVARSLEETSPPIHASSSKGFAKDSALLKTLKPHHLRYLRDMPLMLHIPVLPKAIAPSSKVQSPISEHILVVHAGLVPGVRLDKQDPYYVMNMRSINRRTHVPSAMRDGKNAKPWFDVWNWYNDRIFRKKTILRPGNAAAGPGQWLDSLWKNFFGDRKARPMPQVIVYGHDSKAGLQIKRWSKGLDSGCVGGGELTAMVLDAQGKYELHSVGCKNYRA